MKLSASLIFNRLKQVVALQCLGVLQNDVLYDRPEFATRVTTEFKPGHLYVATIDNLPRYPVLSNGVMLVCVGGKPPAAFLSSRCASLIVGSKHDIFSVFNALTSIFNELDAWDEALVSAADTAGNIQELLAVGERMLDNPMLLLDGDFFYLAYSDQLSTDEKLSSFLPDANGYANMRAVSDVMSRKSTDMSSRRLVHMTTDYELVTSNLFVNDSYQGSLTLVCANRDFADSDGFILEHFARRIEDSMRHNPVLRFTKSDVIRSLVHNLVSGYPVDADDWDRINNAPHESCFICAKAQLRNDARKIPTEYICRTFEEGVRGCIAFPHAGSIVAVVNCSEEWASSGNLYYDLLGVVSDVDIAIGVGSTFTDLSLTRSYYRQASIALDKGLAMGGDEGMYLFDRFAVDYMVEHSSGEFPDEMLFRRGLDKLLEHDRASQTDYIQTLRTYLDNNMHVTETARALYIHRTSLMARLKRIEAIISADLANPEDRLQLIINLRAIEMRRKQ